MDFEVRDPSSELQEEINRRFDHRDRRIDAAQLAQLKLVEYGIYAALAGVIVAILVSGR